MLDCSRDYLFKRNQHVSHDDVSSEVMLVNKKKRGGGGVPGAIIYLMLQLICFRYFMLMTLTRCLVSNLNKTLLTVSDWLKPNTLSINVKKAHYVV